VSKSGYLWVILPYLFVFLGIISLRSAWGALIGFHFGLLPVLILRWRTLSSLFFIGVSKNMLLCAALFGLSAGTGFWLIWPYTGLLSGFSDKLAAIGLSGRVWVPFILYFALVNPWLEEAYWRNVFGSPSRYPTVADFLFAGYHLIIINMFAGLAWIVFAFVVLVLAGWFWRQISRYTGSLLPAVFSHMLADLSLLVVIYNFSI
jgi:membrane protease YdiL (CAAX protease family)